MNLFDYHLHSEYSFDSSEKIENICEKAVQCGIKEIAITDHVEVPQREEAAWPDFSARRAVIEANRGKYRDVLKIRSGVEIGQGWRAPEQMRELIEREQFDFVLASVHALECCQDPRHYVFTKENTLPFFQEYFRQMIQMALLCEYDCLAHITYLFRFVPQEILHVFPPESFENEYRKLFEAVISRGKGIEINCSGLRMPTLQTTLPSPQILKLYRQCGGRIITLGSDGHSCRSDFSGLEQGVEVLKEAGFEFISGFEGRKAFFQPIG